MSFRIFALPNIPNAQNLALSKFLVCHVWRVLDKLLSGIEKVMILHEMSNINVKLGSRRIHTQEIFDAACSVIRQPGECFWVQAPFFVTPGKHACNECLLAQSILLTLFFFWPGSSLCGLRSSLDQSPADLLIYLFVN